MTISHEVTFRCDACDMNYMIDEKIMELPPGWLALHVAIADSEGCILEHEREVYCHFCSQDCLVEYAASDNMRQRLALADAEIDEDEEDEDL